MRAHRLSELLGCELHLKLETFQATGSFKDRGSLNRLLQLDEKSRRLGVVAMSAGNHAQGVAYHARRLGIPAAIVMPSFAPFSQVERTRRYGAEVILEGGHAGRLRAPGQSGRRGRRARPSSRPTTTRAIIAGQGSIGLELMEDLPDAEAVLVPIGGGGVMAGTAIACQSLKPEVECYGVESDRYPSMSDALAGREPSFGETTIADGIAVQASGQAHQARRPPSGARNFPLRRSGL